MKANSYLETIWEEIKEDYLNDYSKQNFNELLSVDYIIDIDKNKERFLSKGILSCGGFSPEFIEEIYERYKDDENVDVKVVCRINKYNGTVERDEFDMDRETPVISICDFNNYDREYEILNYCSKDKLIESDRYEADEYIKDQLDEDEDKESERQYLYSHIADTVERMKDDYKELPDEDKVIIQYSSWNSSEYDLYVLPRWWTVGRTKSSFVEIVIEFEEL